MGLVKNYMDEGKEYDIGNAVKPNIMNGEFSRLNDQELYFREIGIGAVCKLHVK